jgi:hypothetical protein
MQPLLILALACFVLSMGVESMNEQPCCEGPEIELSLSRKVLLWKSPSLMDKASKTGRFIESHVGKATRMFPC